MLQSINLHTRKIQVLGNAKVITGARVVYLEECRANALARGLGVEHWDKSLEEARLLARTAQVEEEFLTWLRSYRNLPGHPTLADRIMSKPMGEETVSF